MEENINNAIKQAIEDAPERKFVQSVDIAFTIKDVDLKNPTNRIKEEIRLPSGRGREVKVAMFAAGEAATRARDAGIHVITPPEIEELGGNKGRAKKIANQFDFFLSEVPHMRSLPWYRSRTTRKDASSSSSNDRPRCPCNWSAHHCCCQVWG